MPARLATLRRIAWAALLSACAGPQSAVPVASEGLCCRSQARDCSEIVDGLYRSVPLDGTDADVLVVRDGGLYVRYALGGSRMHERCAASTSDDGVVRLPLVVGAHGALYAGLCDDTPWTLTAASDGIVVRRPGRSHLNQRYELVDAAFAAGMEIAFDIDDAGEVRGLPNWRIEIGRRSLARRAFGAEALARYEGSRCTLLLIAWATFVGDCSSASDPVARALGWIESMRPTEEELWDHLTAYTDASMARAVELVSDAEAITAALP